VGLNGFRCGEGCMAESGMDGVQGGKQSGLELASRASVCWLHALMWWRWLAGMIQAHGLTCW
jgi:hypothetical protein